MSVDHHPESIADGSSPALQSASPLLRGHSYFQRVRCEEGRVENAQLLILHFQNPMLMVLTLLRVSEFKECIVHSGKIFSNTRYRTWFRGEHNGFDYEDFVLGMNLPDANFKNFYETFRHASGRDRINRYERAFFGLLQERDLVELCADSLVVRRPFYIVVLNGYLIEMNEADAEVSIDVEYATRKHEISHAIYYLSVLYRQTVQKAWDSLDEQTRGKVLQFMREKSYTDDVILDEFAAYLVEPYDNHFPVDKEQYQSAVFDVTECFADYAGHLLQTPSPDAT